MSAIPVYRMWVRVDGADPVQLVARATVYVPSSGYTSGDYDVTIADVVIRYSGCGTYSATYRYTRQQWSVPLKGAVTFNFASDGGPHITIVSGGMGVTDGS